MLVGLWRLEPSTVDAHLGPQEEAHKIRVGLPPDPDYPELPRRLFEVIFDQSNEQVYSPFDIGFTGMSYWTQAIQLQGGDVSLNSAPLALFLDTLAGPHQVLVLGVALNRHYPSDDLDAVERFLRRGGGVLVLVEHDNVMGNATFQNALLERFGLRAYYGSNETLKESVMPIWTWATAPAWQLDAVQFFFPAPLILQEGPMEPLLSIIEPVNPELPIIGARARPSSGLNMIVLGDAEMVWNGHPPIGLTIGDNMAFMSRVMTSLAQVNYRPAGTPEQPSLIHPSMADQRRALFLRDGHAQIPDNRTLGVNNLYRFLAKNGYVTDIAYYNEVLQETYALVFSLNPLTEIAVPDDWLARQGRVIVATDGQSDYLNSDPGVKPLVGHLFAEDISEPWPIPANALLEPVGLQFDPVTLVDTHFGAHGLVVRLVSGDGKERHLVRPAAVRIIPPGVATAPAAPEFATAAAERSSPAASTGQTETAIAQAADILACAEGAWPNPGLTPLITDDVPKAIFEPPESFSHTACYPVVVASGNRVAVGSISLFQDPVPFSEPAYWLELLVHRVADGVPRSPSTP